MVIVSILFSVLTYYCDYHLISIFGKILGFFETQGALSSHDWYQIFYYLAIKIMNHLLGRHIIFIKCLMYVKTLNSLNSLVYDKLLKLTNSSSSMNEGEIVNLVNVDARNVANLAFTFTSLVTLPINIVMVILMILDKDRNSGMAILGLTSVFVLANFYLSLQNGRINQRLLVFRDARLKVTSQTFSDVKNLKLLGWDEEFMNRVVI